MGFICHTARPKLIIDMECTTSLKCYNKRLWILILCWTDQQQNFHHTFSNIRRTCFQASQTFSGIWYISRTDAKTDPLKTMRTPATSIQFLWPGKIDGRMVYWGMSTKTTVVLVIMLNVVPEIYCNENTKHTHSAADVEAWTNTALVSNKLPGQIGHSTTNVSVPLQIRQSKKDQNKHLHLSSCKHSYFWNMAPNKERDTPEKPADTIPVKLTYFCAIGWRNKTVFFLFDLGAGRCPVPVLFSQHEIHIVQLKWKFLGRSAAVLFARRLSQGIVLIVPFVLGSVLISQLAKLTLDSISFVDKHSFCNSVKQSPLWLYLSILSFVGSLSAEYQGWRTSKTPTRHTIANKVFFTLNISCPHNQKIKSPDSKQQVMSALWAAVSGIKANPMYRAVESSVIMIPYKSIAGTSGRGILGVFWWSSMAIRLMMTTPAHLKTWSSRSGILLCSNWTFVTLLTCAKTNMKAARIPFRLCIQGLCCTSCSVPWAWPSLDPLPWCRSLSDSFVMPIFLSMSPPRFGCIADDSLENHHHHPWSLNVFSLPVDSFSYLSELLVQSPSVSRKAQDWHPKRKIFNWRSVCCEKHSNTTCTTYPYQVCFCEFQQELSPKNLTPPEGQVVSDCTGAEPYSLMCENPAVHGSHCLYVNTLNVPTIMLLFSSRQQRAFDRIGHQKSILSENCQPLLQVNIGFWS